MKKGFTLLELLIVIVILGILASIALPRYFANLEKAREAEAKSTLNKVREAQMGYFANKQAFKTAFPIDVYITGVEGVDQPDISLVEPASPSFTFTISGTCAQAAPKAGAGNVTYHMGFLNGSFGTGGC